MMRACIAGGCLLALAGCTSWLPSIDLGTGAFGTSTAELRVDSEPPGAEAKTSLGPSCRTPCAMIVASRGDFGVTFTLDRFLPQTVTVRVRPPGDPRFDPNASPTAEFIPNPVVVELQPAPPPPRSRRQQTRRRAPPPPSPAAPPPAGPPPLRR